MVDTLILGSLEGPERSSTAQRTAASQLWGRRSSQRAGASALRPRTTSSNWPEATSTMLVLQERVANRPRRQNRVSSSPSATTRAILSPSASNRSWPQRRTDELTVCQSQPSTAAVSDIAPPRPARRVAHRAARVVNSVRSGAMAGSCSLNQPAEHPERGSASGACATPKGVADDRKDGSPTTGLSSQAPRQRCHRVLLHSGRDGRFE